MKRYDVWVTARNDDGTVHEWLAHAGGYCAETAWQAVLSIMTKPDVASLRGDEFVGIRAERYRERG